MKRSAALALLIEIERRARDRQANLAAHARREADTADSTLQMLRGYRLDYDTRSPKRGAQAFTAGKVRVHDAFTGKLDVAIDQQARLAERLTELTAEREASLLLRQRRLKALEMLRERREAALRAHAQRAEQHQTDEFATQSYVRSRQKGR